MGEVRKLQAKVMQISSLIYNVGQYSSSYLMGVKCALSVLGICKNILAQPFSNFKSEQEENISKAIADLKLFHSETQKS